KKEAIKTCKKAIERPFRCKKDHTDKEKNEEKGSMPAQYFMRYERKPNGNAMVKNEIPEVFEILEVADGNTHYPLQFLGFFHAHVFIAAGVQRKEHFIAFLQYGKTYQEVFHKDQRRYYRKEIPPDHISPSFQTEGSTKQM